MRTIHEVATITSKGQLTLPKPIRQALGVGFGGKVAFSLRGQEVVVTRAGDSEHEDPAIARFLAILEKDIEAGRNIGNLPDDMASRMLSALKRPVDEEIHGDVEI